MTIIPINILFDSVIYTMLHIVRKAIFKFMFYKNCTIYNIYMHYRDILVTTTSVFLRDLFVFHYLHTA